MYFINFTDFTNFFLNLLVRLEIMLRNYIYYGNEWIYFITNNSVE